MVREGPASLERRVDEVLSMTPYIDRVIVRASENLFLKPPESPLAFSMDELHMASFEYVRLI
jgi:hypothetical protein